MDPHQTLNFLMAQLNAKLNKTRRLAMELKLMATKLMTRSKDAVDDFKGPMLVQSITTYLQSVVNPF